MKPLILDYKITRSEADNPVLYNYDNLTSLNYVLVNGSFKPFIDLETDDVELITRTKVRRENDDDDFILELETKTKVERERDDMETSLLELSTKTLVKRERDDERQEFLITIVN